MYIPSHFEESRPQILQQAIRDYPFATLVTVGSTGLNANPIPFELNAETGPLGTLRGHVARANPVWRDFDAQSESLCLFHGPQAYVSPSWYATKQEHGKVVPTWNYVAVHAYGILRVIEDRDWLYGLVHRLTSRFEAGRSNPWQVNDAPADFIEAMLRGIVGIELRLTKLIGKWKLSQNRSIEDRAGVAGALRDEGNEPIARLIP